MNKSIVILEDEMERVSIIEKLVFNHFPEYPVIFFDNTLEMLDWLETNLDKSILCLDHDLGPDRMIKGEITDPGTGRDITNFLEKHEPICPVIIHTTNSFGRDAMKFSLLDAGWDTTVVVPSAEIS